MASKKQVVRRPRKANEEVAQLPKSQQDVQPQGVPQPGDPIRLQVPMEAAQNRLLNKLMEAERESAQNGALVESLYTENLALKNQVSQLTENVRALETALFSQNEDKQDGAEDDGEGSED
jgi:hypothetical protein